jgi:hypothetical protein
VEWSSPNDDSQICEVVDPTGASMLAAVKVDQSQQNGATLGDCKGAFAKSQPELNAECGHF